MSDRTVAITKELLALKDQDGRVNPAEVVKWARRNKKSAIHSALTWDDEIAAERYRIWQVRALISVHIVDANEGRGFVSLSIDRPTGGYRQLSDVMERIDLREVMLSDALEELRRVQKRFDRLSELAEVWQAAAKVESRRPAKPKAA